jgi:hypothetical protein
MPASPPCIFCVNPRTNKRGEHVWDNWLNRQDGKEIHDPSTTAHFGVGGQLIRSHRSTRIDVTIDVVCDSCNNKWMSDLSNRTKQILEPLIRRDIPRDFNAHDIVTITAFAFMKAAVLDWMPRASSLRTPRISRSACLAFRESLLSDTATVALPYGLQVWIARYRRKYAMEAQAFTEEVASARHLKGYKILIVTYVVGSFIFQIVYPRWVKAGKRTPTPFFTTDDDRSVQIWPGVSTAYWPPFADVDSGALKDFRERFRRVNVRRRLP